MLLVVSVQLFMAPAGHEAVDHFAFKYRGCGLVGLLACLMVAGRWLHGIIFKHRRIAALGVGVPPAMIGGILGYLGMIILKQVP